MVVRLASCPVWIITAALCFRCGLGRQQISPIPLIIRPVVCIADPKVSGRGQAPNEVVLLATVDVHQMRLHMRIHRGTICNRFMPGLLALHKLVARSMEVRPTSLTFGLTWKLRSGIKSIRNFLGKEVKQRQSCNVLYFNTQRRGWKLHSTSCQYMWKEIS